MQNLPCDMQRYCVPHLSACDCDHPDKHAISPSSAPAPARKQNGRHPAIASSVHATPTRQDGVDGQVKATSIRVNHNSIILACVIPRQQTPIRRQNRIINM